MLCGLAFPRIGIALSFAIVIGLSASLGSLVPLVVLAPAKLVHLSGLCGSRSRVGSAGYWSVGLGEEAARDRSGPEQRGFHAIHHANWIDLMRGRWIVGAHAEFQFCVRFPHQHRRLESWRVPAECRQRDLAVALFGGFIGNAGYCAVLLAQKHSFGKFVVGGALSHWALAGSMGVRWNLGLFRYGWGANLLGDMKAIVGWPVFQAITIITSTFIGVASGEWKDAPSWFVRRSCLGVTLLIVAIVLISSGNNL